MLENKDYCDYDTCVALTKIGFPRWELPYEILSEKYRLRLYDAQKWLREKGIFVHISHPLRVENDVFWNYEVLDEAWDDGKQNPCICASGGLFDSYEEALSKGIKVAVKILKEKEFHNLRKAFYIDKSIVWIPQGKSHKEYFDSINHSDFIETKVRGYILNDTLSLYKGSDFSIPPKKEVENIVSLFASFNIKQINLGCNIGNIGEVWTPKEIIKLLKEEE